jgi:hypothetical protein
MVIRTIALLLTILVASSHALATDSSFPKIEEVGKALYEKDRAAWLATDRLMETSGQAPGEIRGWVTLSSDDGWRVFFVEEQGDAYCSRLSVLVGENGVGPLGRSETCEALTPEQRAMFLARQTALAALRTRCSENYNTVVLPHDGAEAAWVVYLLAATQEPGKVVVGGHVRVLVADGGTDIVDYQKLSNTCLTLDMPSSDEGKPVAVVAFHVLDDHPIETHVFLSLLHEQKLYVMTESAMWRVAEGKVKLLMDGEDYKAYLGRAKAAHEEE